jgi:hypothetical protein
MTKFQVFLLALFFLIVGSPLVRVLLPFNLGAHTQPLCGILSAFFFLWFSILVYFEKYGQVVAKISFLSSVLALFFTFLFMIYKLRGGWFFGGHLDVNKYYLIGFFLISTLIFYMATSDDCKESKIEDNAFVDFFPNHYFSNRLSARKIVILAEVVSHLLVGFFYTVSIFYMQFIVFGWIIGANLYIMQKFYEKSIS